MMVKRSSIFYVFCLFLIALLLYPSFSNPTKKYLLGPTSAHKTIYVADNFSEEEYGFVKDAAKEWADETKGIITFDIYFGFTFKNYESMKYDRNVMVLVKANSDEPIVDALDKRIKVTILGYFLTKTGTQTVLIVPDRLENEDLFRATVIHELGHSIGLKHIDERDAIMYESLGSEVHLTKQDIKHLCKTYYCDESSLGGF